MTARAAARPWPPASAACRRPPQGTRTLTAAYAGSDEFEGSADTEGHTVAAPQPISTTTRITADDPDPSDVGPGRGRAVQRDGGVGHADRHGDRHRERRRRELLRRAWRWRLHA